MQKWIQRFKASQYNHVTDAYEKIPVVTKKKEIEAKGYRDLYSAFLILKW